MGGGALPFSTWVSFFEQPQATTTTHDNRVTTRRTIRRAITPPSPSRAGPPRRAARPGSRLPAEPVWWVVGPQPRSGASSHGTPQRLHIAALLTGRQRAYMAKNLRDFR